MHLTLGWATQNKLEATVKELADKQATTLSMREDGWRSQMESLKTMHKAEAAGLVSEWRAKVRDHIPHSVMRQAALCS